MDVPRWRNTARCLTPVPSWNERVSNAVIRRGGYRARDAQAGALCPESGAQAGLGDGRQGIERVLSGAGGRSGARSSETGWVSGLHAWLQLLPHTDTRGWI